MSIDRFANGYKAAALRIAELESALAKLADLHHRTLTGSKLHDPERVLDWRDCACRSCRDAATSMLAGLRGEQ